jgi:MFS family permease
MTRSMRRRAGQARGSVFAIPSLLSALTFGGLAAALFGDAEAWRWCAWTALGTPIFVIALRIPTAGRQIALPDASRRVAKR